MAKKFVRVCPEDGIEKPKQTFWPPNISSQQLKKKRALINQRHNITFSVFDAISVISHSVYSLVENSFLFLLNSLQMALRFYNFIVTPSRIFFLLAIKCCNIFSMIVKHSPTPFFFISLSIHSKCESWLYKLEEKIYFT